LIYNFENYSLDVDRQELRRAGNLVVIEPQVLDLLQYLIRNRQRIVSKDDLIANVWNGRIVSDSTVTSRITSARQAIGDSGNRQRLIRTVARKGIRFVGEIEENLGSRDAHAVGQVPDKPSIAVLPFQNMSGDPAQEYFGDGITEDITTALSRLRWFFVIARNSSFAYKGKVIDVRAIARELGVRYVLEGSVRKGGGRVRITAQLIDATSGNQIWAQRYDRELADIFALQDEIAANVVATIEPQLYAAEDYRAKQKPPESLDAWDCVARGLSLILKMTKNDNAAAQELLKKAITIDPSYAQAYSLLAFSLSLANSWGWQPSQSVLGPAWDAAQRAIQLDADNPWAHLALGHVHRQRLELQDAVAEFQNAIALNPNFAFAHTHLGLALCFLGRSEQGSVELDTAERLSPRDFQASLNNIGRAIACFIDKRYRDGIDFARKAVRQSPDTAGAHHLVVVNSAVAGEVAEAKAALRALKHLEPALSLGTLDVAVYARDGDRRRYREAFRVAGLK
jgi:TolB-like protein/Tfp pilus assembly protein PilF